MMNSLKVIFWNLWGGKHSDKVLEWLAQHPADMYCFQEVFRVDPMPENRDDVPTDRGSDPHLLEKLRSLLGGVGFFSRADRGHDYISIAAHYGELVDAQGAHPSLEQGLATFVGSGHDVAFFDYEVHDTVTENTGLATKWMLQIFEVSLPDGRRVTIGNVRGLWHKDGKADNPFRIQQSQKIIEALARHPGPYILGGDLNILPDTESLKILKDFGLTNLIETFDIKTTRSSAYKKSLPWADYCLVSDEIEVVNFTVPDTDASDHLPLVLEFRLK